MNILFLLPRLDSGGTERQALQLAAALDPARAVPALAVLFGGGDFAAEAPPGLAVHRLTGAQGWSRALLPAAALRLAALARTLRPDVVCGFQPVTNLLALLAGRAGGARVVFGMRHSDVDWRRYSLPQHWAARLEDRLAPRADLVIANAESGRRRLIERGWPQARIAVVPNGVDTRRFAPDPEAGRRWREARGVAPDAPLLLLAARLDPMKGHEAFLRAAALVRRALPGARFACAGRGDERTLAGLRALAADLGLGEAVLFTGYEPDMPAALAAADLCVSASAYGEGFPNSLAEAMACATPCVATDVGDSAALLGGTGRVVPPASPALLARAALELLSAPGTAGPDGRRRVQEHFDVAALARRTMAALEALPPRRRPCAA